MALENPPTQRLAIHSLEGSKIVVTPMFNPKEVSIDKSVPWAKQASSRSDNPALAFWSADGCVMSFELMFNTFESGTDVHATSVANLIQARHGAGPRRC